MTPEGKVKDQWKKFVKSMPNIWGYFPIPRYNNGIPDWIGQANGRFIAVEFKSAKGTVKGIQQMHLNKITACGGYARVADPDNIHMIIEEVRSICLQ